MFETVITARKRRGKINFVEHGQNYLAEDKAPSSIEPILNIMLSE